MCCRVNISKSLLLLFTITVLEAQVIEANDNTEGYYWRDYNGEIPSDALPGGHNSKGETTYIGQVLHKDQLIPAKIDGEVYYEWGYQEFKPTLGTQPIKILCTRFPEQFEWLTTGNGLMQYLSNKHLIIGGFEIGAKIYIGRKQLDDELAVGKIIQGDNQSTLNTTKDGKGTQHAVYDILTYNPNIQKQSHRKPGGTSVQNTNGTISTSCAQHEITINYYA